MKNRTIICISRQLGSGGKNIGQKLAKQLGIEFYDQKLIEETAKESGMCRETVEELEETPTNSLLYSMYSTPFFGGFGFNPVVDLPMTDRLFVTQADIIREAAKKGSCVIVGRCADYILKDDPDLFTVFIHRDQEERVNQISKTYDISLKKAEELVKKGDKKRSHYYNYYSDRHWGEAENYDMTINSDILGEDYTVELIVKCLEKRALRIKARG